MRRLANRALTLAGGAAVLLAAGSVQAAPDVAGAKALVERKCSVCHGVNGESSGEYFPRLAGQHAEYIVKQLHDFKEGRREGQEMSRFAKNLSDEMIEGLALYFAEKKIPPQPPSDRELAGVGRYIFNHGNRYSGVPACKDCHGPGGEGTPRLPRLAGQRSLYIERQLKDFNKRARTNDNEVMHLVASKLTELELMAVAQYISSLP